MQIVLVVTGAGTVAFLADLLSVNRRLLEDVQYRLKKQQFNHSSDQND